MKIDISNLAQTEVLGRKIGEFLSDFDGLAIFYLDGDLGTGKTTLVREILKAILKLKKRTFEKKNSFNNWHKSRLWQN